MALQRLACSVHHTLITNKDSRVAIFIVLVVRMFYGMVDDISMS